MVERLAQSVSGPQMVDRIRTAETIASLMCSADGVVLVSGGGFIAGCIQPTIINPDPVAFELGWYAEDRSGLALIRSFEVWAHSRGAVLVKMSCRGGVAQKILQRRGYRLAEIQMVR
ncbi:hypothetical protein [Paenirhodobacter populi]|uniref:hypothetical protein n=1 Tax=Paenirhodobacter populi TaxID=2306993 RepID=UPI000FE304C6|nr:hypothetical protein [Sinirhodobacter populi]RWR09813.1 hypothetical protein D2T32_05590 [Sinirhodobacter populi]